MAGILRQNPDFHAAMSSPVAALMNGALEQTGAGGEFHTFFDEAKRKRICHALFNAYYEDKDEVSVIFDTNRIWSARLHQLTELFSDSKLICCVRNPAWVMDSFERVHRQNPFDYSRMYSAQTRMTVYSRCESMISAGGVVGSSWTALKEAYYGDFSERLLILDYDLLVQRPQRAISLLYKFLELEEFEHDFDNVEYEEAEFDEKLGAKGLHTVKRKVKFTPRRTVLPPDLFSKYSDMAFWEDHKGTQASIIAPASANDEK